MYPNFFFFTARCRFQLSSLPFLRIHVNIKYIQTLKKLLPKYCIIQSLEKKFTKYNFDININLRAIMLAGIRARSPYIPF